MPEQEAQIGTAKGIDGAVKHCVNCGVEFDDPLRSSCKIQCQACGVNFLVRIYE